MPLVNFVFLVAAILATTACSSPNAYTCKTFEVADSAPELYMIRSYSADPGIRAAALEGMFTIRGEKASLHVPVEWHQDPFGNRSWRMCLHALDALKPLLVHYSETGDVVALEKAGDFALDWIEHNRLGAEGLSEFAWYDMAVSYRAARLAYLYRALEHEKAMTPEQRKELGCSVGEHAHWLRDNDHYKYRNNHGLFSDVGLFIVGKQLDKHPDANGWRKRATERFVQNVTTTVSTADGVHLEHSAAYHVLVSQLLNKLINELGFAHDELKELYAKMVAAAPWFVMPDGRYPQFGDTNLSRAPRWVMDIEDQHTGFNAFLDAGAAVYRDDSSYFMTATWYHSRAHKHADETSFVWAENGRRLIVDTGGYGYFYEEPGRIYAESSQAHNSLTLDTPFGWRNNKPYGSGVLDTVSEGGWHAVLAKNPLLARQSVDHRRMFAYLPGQFLIVIDQLNASVCPVSTRRFHFAPKLEVVEQDGGSVRLADDRDSVWLQTGARPREMRAVRGQKLPSVQGFTFPSQRNWVPSTAIEAEDRVCGEPMVVALSVGETKPAFEVSGERDGARIVIGDKQLRLQYGANLLALTVE